MRVSRHRDRAPKLSIRAIALIFLVLAPACGELEHSPLGLRLATGMGVAAKQLCSLHFVSGLEPDRAQSLYIEPLLREGSWLIGIGLSRKEQVATATLLGLPERRAVHRDGLGCTLVLDEDLPLSPPTGTRPAAGRPMGLARAHRDAYFDPEKLQAAIDRAFDQDPEQPPVNTLAVVVLHDGVLVGERYAAAISPETRLPGWSMTKSVTATLVGVLAHQGRLDVHAAGAIRDWRDSGDPRAQISLDHLLRMTSGLAIAEPGSGGGGADPNSTMLYHEPDAARFAATRGLDHEIGAHFEYMSGNYVLAMRAVQDAVGEGLEGSLRFFRENLFAPLGMQSAVLEPDQAGTFIGSSYMLATARDWARFGQLYIDEGMAGTQRIVSENWVDYVSTPTPQSVSNAREDGFWESGRSAFGAGFWLFGPHEETGLPPDTFDANGFQGQYVHMIPSKRLVVVRLGATNFRDYDHDRLPRQVIGALRP